MSKKFLSNIEIAAGIKITSGTPGSGKVLTSDADGDATWDDAPGGGTLDATPTDGSTNGVESNGVFDALATKQATLVSETNLKSVDGAQSLLGSGGITTDLSLLALQALGSVIKGQTVGVPSPSWMSGQSVLSTGRMEMIAVYLPVAATITGVKFWQQTQGVFTANNTNSISLYSYSGGTLTKEAESANNGNIWKGASTTIQTVAFASSYAAAAGIYFVGYLYSTSSASTAPTVGILAASVGGNANAFDFTNSAKLHSNRTSQTAAASSYAMSDFSATTIRFYAALY